MNMKDYMEEFNNLSARVGLSETTKQLTTRYLVVLRVAICDELGIGWIMTLEASEECIVRLGPRRPTLPRTVMTSNIRGGVEY